MNQRKGVFAGGQRKTNRGGDKKKAGPGTKGRTPARPLAELEERRAREKARTPKEGLTLRQRVSQAFPLFGVVGTRELGLILAIAGGTAAMWPRYRALGFLVAALGFVVMRSGEGWLRNTK